MAFANLPLGGYLEHDSGLDELGNPAGFITAEEVRAGDVAAGGPSCRECGCTDNAACPDACSWAEPDLCSACRESAE